MGRGMPSGEAIGGVNTWYGGYGIVLIDWPPVEPMAMAPEAGTGTNTAGYWSCWLARSTGGGIPCAVGYPGTPGASMIGAYCAWGRPAPPNAGNCAWGAKGTHVEEVLGVNASLQNTVPIRKLCDN